MSGCSCKVGSVAELQVCVCLVSRRALCHVATVAYIHAHTCAQILTAQPGRNTDTVGLSDADS